MIKQKLTATMTIFATFFPQIVICDDVITMHTKITPTDRIKMAERVAKMQKETEERQALYSCLKAWEFINKARTQIKCPDQDREKLKRCRREIGANSLIPGVKENSELILSGTGNRLFTLSEHNIQRTVDIGTPHKITTEDRKAIYDSYIDIAVKLGTFIEDLQDTQPFCPHLNEGELKHTGEGLQKCQALKHKSLEGDQRGLANIQRATAKIKTCQDALNTGPRNTEPKPTRGSPK